MAVNGSLNGLVGDDRTATDRTNGLVTGTFAAVGPTKAFDAWGPFNVQVWVNIVTTLTIAASGSNAGVLTLATNISKGDAVNSTLVPAGTTIASIAGANVTFAFPTQAWHGSINAGVASIQMAAMLAAGTNLLPNGKPLSSLVGSTVTAPSGYFPAGTTVLAVGPDATSLLLSAAPTSAPASTQLARIYFALTANSLTAGADAAASFTGASTPLGQATSNFNIERSLDGGQTWTCCNIGGSQMLAQFGTAAVMTGPLNVSFGDPEQNSLYRINVLNFTALGGGVTATNNYRFSTSGQAGMSLQSPALA